MKKITTVAAFLLAFTAFLSGQSTKKYPLLQHFTNSNCSICASKNPAFFSLINGNADVHHLAVHPSFPYPSCVFYQANTAENTGVTSLYGINGTPRLAVDGVLLPAAGSLMTQAQLTAATSKTSPIWIGVTETKTGSQVKVEVTVQSIGAPPSGDWKLFVAAAEKTINQTTGNGEAVHHNVLRDLLPGVAGEPVALSAAGGTANFSFTYDIKSGWKEDQMYALAWVQNLATKEVLNSATRFDPVFVSTTQLVDNQSITLAPNPATDEILISLADEKSALESVEIFSIEGRSVLFSAAEKGSKTASIDVAALPSGVFVVRAKTADGTATSQFVKE